MGLICEDISCCDRSQNAPVQVFNKIGDRGPSEFTYTNQLIFKFVSEPSGSNKEDPSCNCKEHYNDDGTINTVYQTILRECLDPKCSFRFLAGGLKFKLQIYYQEHKNFWGVKAMEYIPEKRFLTEYIGEVHKELGEEIENDDYIFSVFDDDLNNIFPLTSDGKRQCWNIDAHEYGNVSRFFNHSCCPNVSSYFVRVGSEPFLRIAFYSFREILIGEELTIDYGQCWCQAKGDTIKCKCDYKLDCKWRS